MRVFAVSLVLLMVIVSFIGIHACVIRDMSEQISENCNEAELLALGEKWTDVVDELYEIRRIWNAHRMWASLTISTKDIEQIEISLAQSIKYAELGEKSDFAGEFTMFSMLIQHLPHQEGFHIEEIL